MAGYEAVLDNPARVTGLKKYMIDRLGVVSFLVNESLIIKPGCHSIRHLEQIINY